jgi:hypothetical protein
MELQPQSQMLYTQLQKYIPQCDKQNQILLRFGRIIPSNYGTIMQLPVEPEKLRNVQSYIQNNQSRYKKTVVSGYRIQHNGFVYVMNRHSGEMTKIHREHHYHCETSEVMMDYDTIEEDSGIVPCIDEANMEEEYEQTIYTSSESGLIDIDWIIEYFPGVRITSLYCVIRKPVQPQKLWKLLETFGLDA